MPLTFSGQYRYVDSDSGSDADGNGKSIEKPYATIQTAVTDAGNWGVVFVKAKNMAAGATDPSNYAETVIIPATHEGLQIIGVGTGRVQGGLPQIKMGSGTTAMLTIRAPGCSINNMGFNGIWTADSTQSLVGILLDDDASTKTAFGTTIENCHFKNCAGSTASTNAATGGAITWAATGGAWQVLIKGNRFYKNVGDVVLIGTSGSVPQDVIIEDNVFSGPAASVDCNVYTGGDGINGLIIKNNYFQADPAITSASNGNFLMLTGSVGLLAHNYFACYTAQAGTDITFGATAVNKVPTTMFMAGNYGEFSVGTGAGYTSGEIWRT